MAELVVSAVLEGFVARLTQVLIDEATLLAGIAGKVEWIESELRSMQGLLQHVEQGAYDEQPEGLPEWADKLKEIARDADDVIRTFVLRSVKRRRRGVLYWFDKYKVAKDLDQIRRRMIDISQTRMNLNTDVSVSVETPGEASSSTTTVVAPAIEKLDHILSQNMIFLDERIEIVERVKGELGNLQNIVSNIESTGERESVWLEEVNDVFIYTADVAENFINRRVKALKMARFEPILFFCTRYEQILFSISGFNFCSTEFDYEMKFGEQIKYIRNQIGDALCRRLTYEVGGNGMGAADKQTPPRSKPVPNFSTAGQSIIGWIVNLWRSMDKNLKCTQRDLALMRAFLSDTQTAEGLNERQKVWLGQLRVVAQNGQSLIAACSEGGYFRRIKFAVGINSLLKEIRTISHRKTIYDIANIQKREAFVPLGPSVQQNDIIEPHNDNFVGTEEHPPTLVVSSCWPFTGFKEKIQSIKEEMELMNALFQDVQNMGEQDRGFRIWVEQMKVIAREIESFLDNYVPTTWAHKLILRYGIERKKIDEFRNKIEDALRRRETYQLQWSRVLGQPNQDKKSWSETHNRVNADLPLYLRRCLFYFVQFPAEFEIPVRRLVVLWVAESLVHHEEDGKVPPEQVAERYLIELIDRNMVQIAKRKRNGKVKTCRLPNALRQFLSTKANESQGHIAMDLNIDPKKSIIRRVADHLNQDDIWHNHIHGDTDTRHDSASLRNYYKGVLSFLSFDAQEGSKPGQQIGNFLKRCISSNCFLLLRVLDLERVYKPKLPKSIARLSPLRYLGLRWTYLESLPSSISSLLKLQTLDLKHTYIHTLPSSIWKMELRHLFLSETFRSRFPPQSKGNSLSDLQTLWGLFVDEETPVKDGLDTLVNIRKLGLACQSMSLNSKAIEKQLEALVDWIMKLEHLQSLRLKSRNEEGRPSMLPLKSFENNINLTDMYLLGSLSSSSVLSQFPPSLVELTLSHSKLKNDPMRILKDFPNLQTLCLLAESYVEKTMVCESKSFPKLHVLKFWALVQLEECKIDQGALPCLRELEIRSCPCLKMLPDGLKHVNTLFELKLTNMPTEINADIHNNNIPPNCQVVQDYFQ